MTRLFRHFRPELEADMKFLCCLDDNSRRIRDRFQRPHIVRGPNYAVLQWFYSTCYVPMVFIRLAEGAVVRP